MNKLLIGSIVVVLGIALVAYLLQNDTATPAPAEDATPTETTQTDDSIVEETDTVDNAELDSDIAEFTITGTNFEFSEENITVQEGQTVRITFINGGGMHDFVIDEFDGARTAVIQSGEQETIEFVADQSGSFTFYCSVGQHRALGMEGTLVVE